MSKCELFGTASYFYTQDRLSFSNCAAKISSSMTLCAARTNIQTVRAGMRRRRLPGGLRRR